MTRGFELGGEVGFLSLFEGHKARIRTYPLNYCTQTPPENGNFSVSTNAKRAITSNLFPGGVPQYLVAYLSGGHTAEGQLVHNVSLGMHSQLTLA